MLLAMGKVQLDEETADRMLAGVVDPADAPPGFEAVGRLLETVRGGSRRAVAAGPAGAALLEPKPAAPQRRGGQSMVTTTPHRIRISAVAIAAALCATTGAAYAAGLPAAASSTADAVLQKLGIAKPAPAKHEHSRPADTHGSTVSTLAHTTTATGRDKGAAISAVASAGKSRAGQHRGKGAGSKGTSGDTQGDGQGKGKGKEISTLARTTPPGPAHGSTVSTAASGGKSHAGEHGGGSSTHGNGGGSSGGSGKGHGHGGGQGHGHSGSGS
jgi:hypothetical protein